MNPSQTFSRGEIAVITELTLMVAGHRDAARIAAVGRWVMSRWIYIRDQIDGIEVVD